MSTPRRRFTSEDSPSRKRSGGGYEGRINLENIEIPFLDADADGDEIPLDDLDTFVVPSRDEKGISEPFHMSVAPIMLRHIDVIIRSGRFPYLRRSDLIRHAVVRHLRWLISIRQSVPRHMLVALEAIMEDCRESEQRMRVEEVLNKIEERVEFHLGRGDVGEALRLLSVMRARVDSSFEDYWGREVKKTLDEKFFKPLLSAGSVLKIGAGKNGAKERVSKDGEE